MTKIPIGGDDIDSITTQWKAAYVIIGMAVYAVFTYFGQSSRGLIAAGSFASIALLARARWDLRRFPWFWTFLAACVLLHLAMVIAFSAKINVHPTIALAPLGLIDYAILLILLFQLERMMRRHEV